jgi:hypothetical protein
VVYDPSDRAPKEGRPEVSTLEIAPTLLHNFGVKPPSYMKNPVAIGTANGS